MSNLTAVIEFKYLFMKKNPFVKTLNFRKNRYIRMD